MDADTRIKTVTGLSNLVDLLGEVLKLGDSTLTDDSMLARDLDSAVAMDDILLHLATIRFDLQSHQVSEIVGSAGPGDLEHAFTCLQKVKETVSCLTDSQPASEKSSHLPWTPSWRQEKLSRLEHASNELDASIQHLQDRDTPSADVPRFDEVTLRDESIVPSLEDYATEDLGCLHDGNDEWQPVDKKMEAAAQVWQSELQDRTHALIDTIANPQDPVRVAIIDTGASFGAKAARMYSRRIKDCRSWVEKTEQAHACGELKSHTDCDLDGHGTHTASVLLTTDKHCEIYIAKAFRARKEKQDNCTADTHLAVANAVRYAAEVWKVDVISMSFGFNEVVDEIEDAFKVVAQRKGIMLAAASNSGNNHDTVWPARNRDVVYIYAADGYGNAYPRNPTPLLHDQCFSFLGTEVSGHWCHEQTAHRSGTSVATAVAAGIVCLVVRYMRDIRASYLDHPDCDISAAQYDRRLKRLTAGSGAIIEIFYLMSDQKFRGGYHAVKPWKLLDAVAKKSAFLTVTEILRAIDRAR